MARVYIPPMDRPTARLAIVMERVATDNRWQSYRWQPIGALDDTALGNYSAASGGLVEDSGQRKPLVDTLTFDAGATVRIGESFHIGIVGHNLTHPGPAILPSTVGSTWCLFGGATETASISGSARSSR